MTIEGRANTTIIDKLSEERPLIAATKFGKSEKLGQYVAALSACLGSLAAGAVTGWTGNISDDLKELTYNGIVINDTILEWIGSISLLGSAISCIPITVLCDVIGRKVTMLLLSLPCALGWLFIIFAKEVWMLYFGRFLTGTASGAFLIIVPLYICEIAEKDIRGTLASCSDWLVSVGTLFAYTFGLYFDMHTYTIIMGILPVVFAFVFSFQPESPTYLIRRNEYSKAKNSLIRVRGKSFDVEKELEEIKPVVRGKKSGRTFINSLEKKSSQRALLICFALMIFEQASGINAVLTYAETIFDMTGIPINSQIMTIIIGALQVVATLFSTIAVDQLGRRILLISSNLGTMISMACFAIFFTLHDRNIVDETVLSRFGLIPIILLSFYVVSFSFGMGPLTWVLTAELLPTEIKSLGGGCAATLNFLTAFFITNFFFDIGAAIGNDTAFYLFSLISLIIVMFVYYFVPETKDKSLRQIQMELDTYVS